LLIAVAAHALIASACGSDKKDNDSGASSNGPNTVTVNVDAKSDTSANGFASAFTQYFPADVTLHPGDSVKFVEQWTGEPHTVSFGTLVTAGLAAADALPPGSPQPAELLKVPDVFPPAQGDAVQTSGQPCFLATGDLPANGAACAKVTPEPAFTGTETYFNSGFLPEGATWTMKLADTIAPGTYRYMCAIHRNAMQGKVTVVAKTATAQTAAQVASKGASETSAAIAKMKTLFNGFSKLTADTAAAGGVSPDVPAGVIAEFGPKTLTIKTNSTVTWDVAGPHTISFNAPESAVGAMTKAPDGSVHLNPPALGPAGGGTGGALAPPAKPTVLDGGKWDGTGFYSSGTLLGFGPPGILKYKLTFTKAGTYQYRCLFHPDMQGTVNVTA
jgi:plastocyanin